MNPTPRRRGGSRVDDAASAALDEVEGTRFEELPPARGEAAAALPEEPAWLSEAPADERDPEARASAADRAQQDRYQAEVAESRRREILGRLNPEQARAVTTTEGPVLILAGAGSGKTRVLAHRIAYLVGVQRVPPFRILAVTFTNRAAGELRERIIRLVGEPGKEVQAGTFHSINAQVLRRDGEAIGINRRFVIYDTEDQQQLMKRILREEGLDAKGETRPAAILGAISRAKNDMLDPKEIPPLRLATGVTVQIARLARLYEKGLRDANALDFDDLLLEAVRLFEEAPQVLARYQERWRYLHVDEYQDTNRPQYLWIKALAAKHGNLAVVGDDDQSIYGWRGADIRNILDFERDWPKAAVIKLEQNYRSTQLILDAAHAVVSKNLARSDKKLWTKNDRGRLIERFEEYNEGEEAEWIVRRVEELTGTRSSTLTRRADDGASVKLRDIAILYRTNAQSRAIEEACLRYGIRYQVVGGTRFYSRREVKDALAYLRVLRSDADGVSFERVINVPARAIGDKTVAVIRAFVAREGVPFWLALERAAEGEIPELAGRARGAIAEFVGLLRRLRSRVGVLPLPELLDDVLERSGYRAMLADGTEEGEERWANLLELREVTTRYDDLSAEDALDRLLEETALVADQDSYQSDADMLSLITLHAAKGLEFDVVFIAGLEESLFPTGRAVEAESGFNPDPRPMEEERRLAYVGMTRARQRLYLSHAWQRATRRGPGTSFMAEPSRFLLEIPQELMSGPRLGARTEDGDTYDAPDDLNLVFGRGATRFGRPIRPGGGAFREGSGRPGAPRDGEQFRPSRDLAAKRDAFASGARSGTFGSSFAQRRAAQAWDEEHDGAARNGHDEADELGSTGQAQPGIREGGGARPAPAIDRPVIPGERHYRDGDRVRHPRWGDGIVVSSKLTRSDEEVTIAFRDPQVGRKTLLASLAGLELVG
ncbi:MAG TPA: UvrD-helicase domain-containing protein [Candidatus Limnocylindrales bacterium]|nr:UvrD-helicase domain-containing protein [Candidatus Limnocylindrales bacterium]